MLRVSSSIIFPLPFVLTKTHRSGYNTFASAMRPILIAITNYSGIVYRKNDAVVLGLLIKGVKFVNGIEQERYAA